jgi:hypothetical protein
LTTDPAVRIARNLEAIRSRTGRSGALALAPGVAKELQKTRKTAANAVSDFRGPDGVKADLEGRALQAVEGNAKADEGIFGYLKDGLPALSAVLGAEPVQRVLSVIDKPRALTTAVVMEGLDALDSVLPEGAHRLGIAPWIPRGGDGTFDIGDIVENTKKNKGFGQYVEDRTPDSPHWEKVLAGLVGDIALDPLTYVGGAGVVRSAASTARLPAKSGRLASAAESAAEQLKALGATDAAAAVQSGMEATARRIAAPSNLANTTKRGGGVEILARASELGLTDEVAPLVADYARRGRAALTQANLKKLGISDDVFDAVGGPELRLTFMGKAIPGTQKASEALVTGLDAVARGTRARNVALELSRRNAPLDMRPGVEKILSGSPTEAVKGAQLLSATTSRRSGNIVTDQLVNAMKPINKALNAEGDQNIANIIETGQQGGRAAQLVRALFSSAKKIADAEGVDMGNIQNYFPHMITAEARSKAQTDAGFDAAIRAIVVDPTAQTGIVRLREMKGTIDEINAEFVKQHGIPLFETDPRKVLPAYAEQLGTEVGRARFNRKLETFGVAKPIGKAERDVPVPPKTAEASAAKAEAKQKTKQADEIIKGVGKGEGRVPGLASLGRKENTAVASRVWQAIGETQSEVDRGVEDVANRVASNDAELSKPLNSAIWAERYARERVERLGEDALRAEKVEESVAGLEKEAERAQKTLESLQRRGEAAQRSRADYAKAMIDDEEVFLDAVDRAAEAERIALPLSRADAIDVVKGKLGELDSLLSDVNGQLMNHGAEPFTKKDSLRFPASPPAKKSQKGGEWDWFFNLSTKRQRDLRLNWFNGKMGLDAIVDAVNDATGRNMSIDEWAEEALRLVALEKSTRAEAKTLRAAAKKRNGTEDLLEMASELAFDAEAADFARFSVDEWEDIFDQYSQLRGGASEGDLVRRVLASDTDPATEAAAKAALTRVEKDLAFAKLSLSNDSAAETRKLLATAEAELAEAARQVQATRFAATEARNRAKGSNMPEDVALRIALKDQQAGELWLAANPDVALRLDALNAAYAVLSKRLPQGGWEAAAELAARQPMLHKLAAETSDPRVRWAAEFEQQFDTGWAAAQANARQALNLRAAAEAMMSPTVRKELVDSMEKGFVDIGNRFQGEEWVKDALKQMVDIRDPRKQNSMFRGLAAAYDAVNQYFKAWAVGTPGFVIRNAYSAIWNNYAIGGVGAKAYREFMPMFKVYADNPFTYMDELTRAFGEVKATQFDEAINAVAASGWGQGIHEGGRILMPKRRRIPQPWRTDNKYLQAIQKANEYVETTMRGALAWDAITRKGATMESASELIGKIHFNYRDISEFDRQAKRVIPFWVFQSRNVPLQIAQFFVNPRKMQQFNAVLRNTQMFFGAEEEQVVPGYYAENMAVRVGSIPFFGKGQTYAMPELPFVALNNDLARLSNPVRGLADANPLIKIAAESISGKNLFTDVPYQGLQQAPTWASAPLIADLLKGLNLAETSRTGQTMMRDDVTSWIETLNPALARVGRLAPAANALLPADPLPTMSKLDDRMGSSVASFLGFGVRTNTEATQRGELLRRQRILRDIIDEQRKLGYIPSGG